MDNKVRKIWQEKSKDLIKPNVFLAYDNSNRLFYVIQDQSTIVFMVLENSNTTFAIPKEYCIKEKNGKYYKITDTDKLTIVSCPSKNNYENFVQKYLIA
jgi:hypothetical protein